jgi:hypothetical protein
MVRRSCRSASGDYMPDLPVVRDCACCGPNITQTVVRGLQGQVFQNGYTGFFTTSSFRDHFIMAAGFVSGWTGVMPTRTWIDPFTARAYGLREQMAIHKTGEVIRHVNINTGVTAYYRVKATAGNPLDVTYTTTVPPGPAWEVVAPASYVRTYYSNAPSSGGGFFRNGTTQLAVGDLIPLCVPNADESDDLWHIHDIILCTGITQAGNPAGFSILGTSSQYPVGGGAQLGTGSYPGLWAQKHAGVVASFNNAGVFSTAVHITISPGQLVVNSATGAWWLCVKECSTATPFSTQNFAPFNIMRPLSEIRQALFDFGPCRPVPVIPRYLEHSIFTNIDSEDGSAEDRGSFSMPILPRFAHPTGRYPALDKPITAPSAPAVGGVVRTYNVELIPFTPPRVTGGSFHIDGDGHNYSDGTDQITLAGQKVEVITDDGVNPPVTTTYVCVVPRTTFEPAGVASNGHFVEETGPVTFQMVQRSQRVAYPELPRNYNEAPYAITDEAMTLISASRLQSLSLGETSQSFNWDIWIAKGTLRAFRNGVNVRNTDWLVNAAVVQALAASDENTEDRTLANLTMNPFVAVNPNGATWAFQMGGNTDFLEGVFFTKTVITSIDIAGPQTASQRYRYCFGTQLCTTIAVPPGGMTLVPPAPQLGDSYNIAFNRGC